MDKHTLEKLILVNGKQLQTFVAIEEMSELMKELVKFQRGEQNRAAIIEELADVYIMLEQIEIMFDISTSDILKFREKKIERIKEGLGL